jgi:hypothetical protein
MADLERALTELGPHIRFPETPHVAERVLSTIADSDADSARRTVLPRWVTVAVAAVIAVVLLVSMPVTRGAIAGLLGIGAVEVSIVDSLPPVDTLRDPTGTEMTLDDARALVAFRVLSLPAEPSKVYADLRVPGGMITVSYSGSGGGDALFITQMEATTDRGAIEKLLGPGTTITDVDVGGEFGYWIEGEPHVVIVFDKNGAFYEDSPRMAGNTLLFVRDGLTVRIEGSLDLADALSVALALG